MLSGEDSGVKVGIAGRKEVGVTTADRSSRLDFPLILVAVGAQQSRSALSRCLARGGCQVVEASSAQAALRILQKKQPDLMFLDANLPDADGVAICRQLKNAEHTRHLPIILTLPVCAENGNSAENLASCADACVAGPPHPAEILALVKALLRASMAESALRRSEASCAEADGRFRAVLEQSLDVSYRRDLRSDRYDYISPACHQALGLTVQEMSGMRSSDALARIHPHDLAGVEQTLALAAEAGHGNLEYRWRLPSGEYRWMAESLRVLKDEQGWPAFRLGIVRDVTQQKASTLLLEEKEQKLRMALEAARIGTWIYYLDGNQWELDPQAQALYGLPQGHCIHDEAHLRGVLFEEDLGGMWEAVRRACNPEGDGHYEVEYRIHAPGGFRWLAAWGRVEFAEISGRRTAHRMVGASRDITSSKVAEAELRRASSLLLAISNNTDDPIFAKDTEGRLIFANPATLRLIGRSPGEAIGKTDLEFLEDKAAARAVMENDRRILTTGIAQEVEEFVPYPGGIERFWSSRKSPYRDASGDVIGLLGISRDITERKRVGRQLAEMRERLEVALAAGDVATWVWDIPRDRLYADQNMHRMFGLDINPLEGGPVSQFLDAVHPEERQSVLSAIDHAFQHGSCEVEYRVTDKLGKTRWVLARAKVERDSSGRPVRMPGLVLDVTERRKAEEALRESEELFRTLADSIANLAWMADSEGSILWCNRRWYEFTGTNFEQMSGWGWQRIHDPALLPGVLEQWKRCIATGQPLEMELPLRRADGQFRWFLTCAVPLKDSSGKVVRWFGTNTDVTETREAREMLARGKEQLESLVAERTAKLQEMVRELEHFSYSIIHDMRAPLRAMRGFSEAIGEYLEGFPRKEPAEFLRRICVAADRMDNLITDALNYSRAVREELPLEPVDILCLLRGMLESYPELHPARAEIRLEGSLPCVLGNKAGLTQCFSNLLGNAVKFVQPGRRPRVVVRAEARGSSVRIWVEDNGIGITKSMIPRLFQMFTQSDSSYEGTGIGLALVRKVIERMGGAVGVESELGKGSRFWFELRPAPSVREGA